MEGRKFRRTTVHAFDISSSRDERHRARGPRPAPDSQASFNKPSPDDPSCTTIQKTVLARSTHAIFAKQLRATKEGSVWALAAVEALVPLDASPALILEGRRPTAWRCHIVSARRALPGDMCGLVVMRAPWMPTAVPQSRMTTRWRTQARRHSHFACEVAVRLRPQGATVFVPGSMGV